VPVGEDLPNHRRVDDQRDDLEAAKRGGAFDDLTTLRSPLQLARSTQLPVVVRY